VFDRSFHAPGLYLENFMADAATERIMEFLDESCVIEARAY
jgi:hypothetical protein